MDRELARHVIGIGFHSLSLLESVLPVLKAHCSGEEYLKYLNAMAAVSAEAATQIFGEIYREHPDLEVEVAAKIKKYGQFV